MERRAEVPSGEIQMNSLMNLLVTSQKIKMLSILNDTSTQYTISYHPYSISSLWFLPLSLFVFLWYHCELFPTLRSHFFLLFSLQVHNKYNWCILFMSDQSTGDNVLLHRIFLISRPSHRSDYSRNRIQSWAEKWLCPSYQRSPEWDYSLMIYIDWWLTSIGDQLWNW